MAKRKRKQADIPITREEALNDAKLMLYSDFSSGIEIMADLLIQALEGKEELVIHSRPERHRMWNDYRTERLNEDDR